MLYYSKFTLIIPWSQVQILLGALNPSPDKVAGIFLSVYLLDDDRFVHRRIAVALLEALAPFHSAVDVHLDGDVAPEHVAGIIE